LIGTLGWELIQMSDGTFKRPQVWEPVGVGWLGAGWLVMLVGYIELYSCLSGPFMLMHFLMFENKGVLVKEMVRFFKGFDDATGWLHTTRSYTALDLPKT